MISETDYGGGDEAPIAVAGTNNQVLRNTIFDTGRSGITHFFSPNAKNFYNVIHDYGVLTSDCGGTYTWETDGAGTEIAYNIIYNSLAGGFGNTGLFLDGDCSNIFLHHNLVYNVNTAIKFNFTETNDQVLNNTLLGVDWGLNGAQPVMPQTVFANNILAGKMLWGANVIAYHNLATTVANAGFINAPLSDYRLTPTSPAVDAGLMLPPYTNNYLGNARDIGALESGPQVSAGGTSFAVPPAAPSLVSPAAAPAAAPTKSRAKPTLLATAPLAAIAINATSTSGSVTAFWDFYDPAPDPAGPTDVTSFDWLK